MFIRQTFFLLLTAVCLGNTSFAVRLTTFSTSTLSSPTAAIASVPLNPGEKGEPDSTMSGTTRSGLQINMQNLS
ncbi:hypothetical protein [[Limnothrix rosea] IAM M-220]|uniref:hypothetical protein n=1 Tax=[Limnothrix rosea] IAM M-220 TaxID=454133 RepID=UPI0011159186|nr:hypothetical protein [[Limnothrix rosea] IAM M-220]